MCRLHEQQEAEETAENHLHKLVIPEALYVNENNIVFVVTRRSKEVIYADFEHSTYLGLGGSASMASTAAGPLTS